MNFKEIHLNRIKYLKSEISKSEQFVIIRKNIIDELIILMNDSLNELKIISDDEKIEPNIKYIQLNEKTREVEKISKKIEENYNDISNKINSLNKEKIILLESCIEEYSKFSEEDITKEIQMLLND